MSEQDGEGAAGDVKATDVPVPSVTIALASGPGSTGGIRCEVPDVAPVEVGFAAVGLTTHCSLGFDPPAWPEVDLPEVDLPP